MSAQSEMVKRKRAEGLMRMEKWVSDVRGTKFEAQYSIELDDIKKQLDELTDKFQQLKKGEE